MSFLLDGTSGSLFELPVFPFDVPACAQFLRAFELEPSFVAKPQQRNLEGDDILRATAGIEVRVLDWWASLVENLTDRQYHSLGFLIIVEDYTAPPCSHQKGSS